MKNYTLSYTYTKLATLTLLLLVGFFKSYSQSEYAPKIPHGYTTYTVQKGDTKYGLANRIFKTTINELERLNPSISKMLTVGHEIIVPKNSSTNVLSKWK